jgi:hypothetical protein
MTIFFLFIPNNLKTFGRTSFAYALNLMSSFESNDPLVGKDTKSLIQK